VLDLVGSDATLALAAASAAPGGKIVVVGAGFGSIPFGMTNVPVECSLQTSYSGETWELEEVVALAAAGRLHVSATHISLEDAPAAYARLDRGEHGRGRMIAVPGRPPAA
jgi:propanol-preferring alcohol dehydrogenase